MLLSDNIDQIDPAGEETRTMTIQNISVKALRPTQIAVGKHRVKEKRTELRLRKRQPQELVDFILTNPIRVVIGPEAQVYIIDHHHLGCALLKEGFKTAPVQVDANFSTMAIADFWKDMEEKAWVHVVDGKSKLGTIADIPKKLADMEDDPYRSLAGDARQQGAFTKTMTPYMEFTWTDYFRRLIKLQKVRSNYNGALKKAIALCAAPDADGLPGYTAATKN